MNGKWYPNFKQKAGSKAVKICVPVKRVVDPYVKVIAKKDESGVETSGAKHAMNPFDEIALEQATKWQAQGLTEEIIAVSIGPQAVTETLRAALARGADKAIHIHTDKTLEPLHIAKILKKIAQDEQVDMIMMGKQAIDDDCSQTGPMLAALLDWPQATFVSAIEKQEDCLVCTREVDGGLQTLRVTIPSVITCDLRLNEPSPIPLPKIMKAKSKPLATIEVDTLGVDLTAKLQVEKVTSPAAKSPGVRVESVDSLLEQLRDKEKVLS